MRNARRRLAVAAIAFVAIVAGPLAGSDVTYQGSSVPPQAISKVHIDNRDRDQPRPVELTSLAANLTSGEEEATELDRDQQLEILKDALCFALTLFVVNREVRHGPGQIWAAVEARLALRHLALRDNAPATIELRRWEKELEIASEDDRAIETMETLLC